MVTTVTTERVWNDLHDQLLRFVRSRVRDEASAEDIVQDAFLKIHARIGALRDGDRLESWVWQQTSSRPTGSYRLSMITPSHS
jgi:RNA polymerase sigma-70 factor (ECF subfamily)